MPDELGFGRRLRLLRTRRGVSQLELASTAATTQRHISFLESGRSRPGPDVVHRIAGALTLTGRERNELLLSAGLAPALPETPIEALASGTVMAALRDLLDGFLPNPAVLTTPPGDLVADNRSMALFYEDVDPMLLRRPLNVYRLALHPTGMQPRIENFAEWAAHVRAALHDRSTSHPDSGYPELIRELDGYLPPASADPALAGSLAPMRLRTRLGTLVLLTGRMSLANAADVTLSELELEVFLPADPQSRELLAQLAV